MLTPSHRLPPDCIGVHFGCAAFEEISQASAFAGIVGVAAEHPIGPLQPNRDRTAITVVLSGSQL
jgi:hypothetical protein